MSPGPRRLALRTALTAVLLGGLAACVTLNAPPLRETDHPLAGRIWDPAQKAFVATAELQRRAGNARVVLLGETHDNPEHHRLQHETIAFLAGRGVQARLLMEQFDRDQQPALDAARESGGDAAELLRGWDAAQYRPLIAAAAAAGWPLRAANLPRSRLRPVVREGYATLAAGEAARLALDAAWDEARQAYMASLIEASHCGKVGPALRDGLVRAQRLRDATLADTALDNADRTAVFILGRGHARRDVGVPRYIAVRRTGTAVLAIGMVEVIAGRDDPAAYENDSVGGILPFDLLVFTPRAERPDPCLAFGK